MCHARKRSLKSGLSGKKDIKTDAPSSLSNTLLGTIAVLLG
jgi:hypothetical protein